MAWRWRGPLPTALALVLTLAGPAWGCSERSTVWHWDHCWLSVPRWLVLIAVSAGWWYLCFHRLFPWLLAADRPQPPWPRVAFRRALALFWLLFWVTFVALFAWLSDEMILLSARSLPHVWPWLSQQALSLLTLAVGLGGAAALWWAGRQRRPGVRES